VDAIEIFGEQLGRILRAIGKDLHLPWIEIVSEWHEIVTEWRANVEPKE
jgi:hypothetical protein